jgi:hypothetical protein
MHPEPIFRRISPDACVPKGTRRRDGEERAGRLAAVRDDAAVL